MAEALETELKTYEQHRGNFLEKHEGKHVLIREDHVSGFFDTEQDAIAAGYKQFGYVPFLVKRVEAVEVPLDFSCTALVL